VSRLGLFGRVYVCWLPRSSRVATEIKSGGKAHLTLLSQLREEK
jgi:hypothetical protein